MRALNLLRSAIHYRKAAFDKGLRSAGYWLGDVPDPKPGDVLVIWNRYGGNDELARTWEKRGARVWVVENGWLGKAWNGGEWFTLCEGHHSGAGTWKDNGPERWDSWGVRLAPWSTGTETLILAQRGIGEEGIRSPDGWAESMHRITGGRIRPHPGKDRPTRALDDDLQNARCVLTWHSAAALQALVQGTPVFHGFPKWIGAEAAEPLAAFLAGADGRQDDAARLNMFRRLAWSMWTLDEISTGVPFEVLA
jgi:hypothetical protein